jgi:hypothetical protein
MDTLTKETVRVFWKCKIKGCRETVVRDMPSHLTSRQVTARHRETYQAPDDIRDGNGRGWPIYWLAIPMDKDQRDAFEHNGLMCSTHNRPLWGEVLRATYKPEKVCDGRCINAKRASCDCSCNGEMHGSGNM